MIALTFVSTIGRLFIGFLGASGRVAVFTGTSVSHCFRPPFFPRLLIRQMMSVGYYSLPVVGLTTLFTGITDSTRIHAVNAPIIAERSG